MPSLKNFFEFCSLKISILVHCKFDSFFVSLLHNCNTLLMVEQ